MKTIQELSTEVQTKIAAGEVIERPAYIVKELIDNAIDAKAKKIVIHIEDGGLGKISISDDGIGMSREDLEICFKRYTTSKLKTINDLSKITSMGFRGEALASIAAVSRITIRSRSIHEESGGEVVVEDGVLEKSTKKGMPIGTQIIVENIFSKLPGRQKFLKSKESEYRLILEIITRFVLAFPEIRFEFSSGKSKVFLFPITSFENRVHDVVSADVFPFLIPFEFEKDYLKISGFVSKPQLSYKSTRNIYTFINNRFIRESYINSSLKDSYGTLLEPIKNPYAILFITIPHQLVDVNVHPRKEMVHFTDVEMVTDVIKEAVRAALKGANLQYLDRRWDSQNKAEDVWEIRGGGTKTETAKNLRNLVVEKNQIQFFSKNKKYYQLHNLYIVVETENGILFFDQHAAHERILYEKLYKTYNQSIKKNDIYFLEKPYNLSLSSEERVVLQEFQELLKNHGFTFTINENVSTLVTIPLLLKDHNPQIIVRQILDEVLEKGSSAVFDSIPQKMLTYLSCRGAIKAGDALSSNECKELIEKLQKTENPYTCPHGRPTQVKIDIQYLHTLFKRI